MNDSRFDCMKARLERHQVLIYAASILIAVLAALGLPNTQALEAAINPALALMLFVTFLQVPMTGLLRAWTQLRFLATLLISNFFLVPIMLLGLLPLMPADPMFRLGVLLVLLTPCIDYVVTFSQIGRADARLLLAATPLLLIAQILLLPAYLSLFLGSTAADLVQVGPFVQAFLLLIAAPLGLAMFAQYWACRSSTGARLLNSFGLMPVPATALVLLVVVASVIPQLGVARRTALDALPLYFSFAVIAPLMGWWTARLARLGAAESRAVAFSTATRNSLVVMPIALAVPGAMPLLPALIVTQTLVELLSSLAYMRWIPKLGARD